LLESLRQDYFDIVICADDLDEVNIINEPGKLLVSGVTATPQARPFSKPITASRLSTALTKTAEPVLAVAADSIRSIETNLSSPQLSRYRLLLVEDNFINTEVALGILEDYGYDNVELAENGQEALDRLSSEHYDLVLMDCQMPIVDGYEATRLIRAGEAGDLSTLPIIAMTANAMQGDREKCLSVGMNDYIAKPIDPDKLERTLSNWLPS
jgi:CheY-like chemotaxis protein